MNVTLQPTRPMLTMPAAEAAHLRMAYLKAACILEYGSGGSTVLAGEMPEKTVFSVESDAAWLAMMQSWFAVAPAVADVRLCFADIGPTGEWGHPKDETLFRQWPGYALSVWDRPDFRQPDVVLIDGRFRVACLLATALRTQKPVVALFDDYRDRKPYHAIETLMKPTAMVGRMAQFDIAPMAFPVDRMAWVLNQFTRPL